MKKSTVIDMLRLNLDRHNNSTPWYNSKKHAEEILNLLEEFDLLKPKHKQTKILYDIENMPYEELIDVKGWQPE